MQEIRLAESDAVALVRDSFSDPTAEVEAETEAEAETESDLDSVTPPLPPLDGNQSDGADVDVANMVGV